MKRRLFWLGALILLLLGLMHRYSAPFRLESPLFQGKNVLILVPHQDDELNLAGTLLSRYAENESTVTVAFSTNGDYKGLAELRSREALAVAQELGIPREQVVYLGYGDQWQHQEQNGTLRKHLYFSADGDALWTSHFGATHTYGTGLIEPYADRDYTRNGFLQDLTDLILELRPDVIYCCDYDAHHDHMALDLFFEEALAGILRKEPDYRPTVYKGFCYGTAWYAEADVLGSENLHSSTKPVWDHWERLGISYRWTDRVRLPVSDGDLSRLLSHTELYGAIRLHRSQNGHRFAENILSGDKVFFQRRTDSLLYRAVFTAGDQTVTLWNDFKLKDSEDFSALTNTGLAFGPEITVRLEAPAELGEVWLYDDPDPANNILAGFLLFADGTRVAFGPLDPGGGATVIPFQPQTVDCFTLCFTDTQGEPGLAEIEAYPGGTEEPIQLLMAMDETGDFVYDYWVDGDGTVDLRLYAYPAQVSWEDVTVTTSGGLGCTTQLLGDTLRVTCPTGGRIRITLTSGQVQTTFTVSNPTGLTRRFWMLLQQLDASAAHRLDEYLDQKALGS